MPRYRVGASGYNYAEWKGGFYPEKIAGRAMLPYYAARLPTVEINYTFHRMPTAGLLQGWSKATPAGLTALGDKLAVLLFQLPPWLRKDPDLLDRFIDTLPDGTRTKRRERDRNWRG